MELTIAELEVIFLSATGSTGLVYTIEGNCSVSNSKMDSAKDCIVSVHWVISSEWKVICVEKRSSPAIHIVYSHNQLASIRQ